MAAAVGISHEQTAAADSALVQNASTVFSASRTQAPIDREDLLSRGFSSSQINAMQAQRNMRETLLAHVQRWLLCFACMVCILCPTMFGLLIWLILSWQSARLNDVRCDSALIDWVSVVYVLKVYLLFLHRHVIKYICKHDSTQQPPVQPPLRVRLYNWMFPAFDLVWNIIGICMVTASSDCKEKLPDLYNSVLAFSCCGIFFTVFYVINAVGIAQILQYMMRNGMLTNNEQAAQAGTLERQPVVAFNASEFGDETTCSVCFEDFSDKKEIRKTSCGHYFHTCCLKGWLNVNHTCPLCRADLHLQGTMIGESSQSPV
eukprot:TRINITY_DN67399_c0_g1_i1.p1 TRINITY_DN67399_c0_g1~~TRINITY_DN67399_c0_g1_i1.p1  ORF type:complete len:317 (-),score=40.74 TRINITY_DN67399_c0_g1_i1:222-1172(-)